MQLTPSQEMRLAYYTALALCAKADHLLMPLAKECAEHGFPAIALPDQDILATLAHDIEELRADIAGNEVESDAYFQGAMWEWFCMSRSSYLVIPRTLLCGMPGRWQEKFAALLNECRETYDSDKIADDYSVKLRGSDGRFIRDPLGNYRHPPSLPYRVTEGEGHDGSGG